MSGFDSKVDKLNQVSGASKRLLMFSTHKDLENVMTGQGTQYTPQELKNKGIDGVFYNSEPSLSSDYNDIFLENQNNSVVKFATTAHDYSFEAHWGPMRRNFEPSVSVSSTPFVAHFV